MLFLRCRKYLSSSSSVFCNSDDVVLWSSPLDSSSVLYMVTLRNDTPIQWWLKFCLEVILFSVSYFPCQLSSRWLSIFFFLLNVSVCWTTLDRSERNSVITRIKRHFLVPRHFWSDRRSNSQLSNTDCHSINHNSASHRLSDEVFLYHFRESQPSRLHNSRRRKSNTSTLAISSGPSFVATCPSLTKRLCTNQGRTLA